MSNSSGSYRVSNVNQMKAYDKLPLRARKALQDAVFDWACPPLVTGWRNGDRGYKTGKAIAASIAEWDREHHERDAKRGRVAPCVTQATGLGGKVAGIVQRNLAVVGQIVKAPRRGAGPLRCYPGSVK